MSQFRIDRIAGTGCSTPSDARTGPIRQPVSAAGTTLPHSPNSPLLRTPPTTKKSVQSLTGCTDHHIVAMDYFI